MSAISTLNLPELIHQTLGPLIPAGAPLALFDFPNHANVGDSAIWLGEQDYLKRRQPRSSIIWAADISLSNAIPLPALPVDCVILIHGGGNFGDIWPHHHQHRERVLARYPGHRIIQLPQSIHFDDPTNLEHCRRIFSAHPDCHLIVRDHPSFNTAKHIVGDRAYLCPDMALHLPGYPRPVQPRHEIVALMRTDKEKKRQAETPADEHDLLIVDWLEEPRTLSIRIDEHLTRLQNQYPRRLPALQGLHQRLYERLAAERMRRGSALLASGKVVITDRLHAHVLCMLMGIPHVVLDNTYGKIANVRSAWRIGAGLCHTAEDFSSALDLARGLLARQPQP